ncbi:MAG: hypothetical protein ACP5R5_02170 [Armatimonadota bacterium]
MGRAAFACIIIVVSCGCLPAGAAGGSDPPGIFGTPFMLQPNTTLGSAYRAQGNYGTAIASGSGVFLAAWGDGRNTADNYDFGTAVFQVRLGLGRVQPDGTVLDPVGNLIAEGMVGPTAIAWNGQSFLVVTGNAPIVGVTPAAHGYRVAPTGECLNQAFEFASGEMPAVASNGDGWLAVCARLDSGTRHVYGFRVDSNGQLLPGSPFRLCSFESDQTCPSVAWNGTHYVVAFRDERSAATSGSDIYALRVAPDGTILDPDGFAVCTEAGDQEKTAAAAGGSTVLVAWEDKRGGSEADIYATPITDSGGVVYPNGRPVCRAAGDDLNPKIAGGANGWIVVWEDNRAAPSQIYRARLGPDGRVIEPDGVAVYASSSKQVEPSLAFDATECLVCWSDNPSSMILNEDVIARRFDLAGHPLDAQPFSICQSAPYQRSIRLARTPTAFMAVFQQSDGQEYNPDLYIAPLDADGNITPAGEIPLKTDSGWDVEPAIAFDGTNCLVAWKSSFDGVPENFDLLAARVSSAGAILDSPPITVCSAPSLQHSLHAAYGAGVYLLVWTDHRTPGHCHIYGARIRPNGTVLDPNGFLISPDTDSQWMPAVGSDGSKFLVTWMEHDSIFGRLIDPVDPAASPPQFVIEVSGRPPMFRQSAVASSGSEYLVVSSFFATDDSNSPLHIRARRLALDGTPIDTTPISICDDAHDKNMSPIVCWNGESYVIEWLRFAAWHHKLRLARVLPTGEVLEDGIVIPGEMTDDPGGLLMYDSSICPAADGRVLIAHEELQTQPPYGVDRIMQCWFNPPQVVQTISAARVLPDDTLITIPAKPVSAGTEDLGHVFYIEEPDRSSGMRVLWSAGEVPRGSTAVVSGLTKTVGGERLIEAQAVSVGASPGNALPPLGLINRSLGGTSPNPIVPQIPGSCGAYNTGLLVRTWGRVTAAGDDWFYVDDGSALDDGSTNLGLKVTLAGIVGPPFASPQPGHYVLVTGLSSCEVPVGSTDPVRLLRPRCASDISDLGTP